MISDDQRAAYCRDGFIVVPDLLNGGELAEIRCVIAGLVAGAAEVDTHTDVYDLEPGHARGAPQVRRIKQPHTNDDILAIGVMLDDTDLENGPLMVVPGSHRGPVWNHHGDDGRFCGLVDPADIETEIARAVPLTGRAGSMSFHHVRALHGSALNTSERDRNLLLYEIMAADAWPLLGVKDYDDYNRRLLAGASTIRA